MIPRHNTVLELLDHAFSTYDKQPAFTCAGHTLSYAEINDLSLRFAGYLHNQLGLEPGDRIALQLPNILQYPVALYGAIRAGLVVVNTNPLYTARELKHQLNDSGAKALVVLSNVAKAAADIVKETGVKHVILTDFADLHPAPKRQLVNFVVRHVKKLVPAFTFEKPIPFRDTLKSTSALKNFSVTGDSLLALQYTGGTTGVSKGAMLSHHNMSSNVWQMLSQMPTLVSEEPEVFIACLPLYHVYGFNLHALCALYTGAHNILIPNPRDLKAMVAQLKKVQMTVFVGINTLYVALCRYPDIKSVDFSKLHISAAGGMAMTEGGARAWKELTGSDICEGYGLSETSPVVSSNPIDAIKRGTIGIPIAETEVKLIDEEGNSVAAGDVGELCVRGPQVMAGYWQRPDETAKVLSDDGWLRTGDMATQQDDGYLKIVDRKKDMILVSGFNVYPNEIEDVVSQHPDVVEAAAIGVQDDHSGEVVKLVVVPGSENVTADAIKAYCKENLTAYKCPKIVEFRESLPKTNVGKILRRELREVAQA